MSVPALNQFVRLVEDDLDRRLPVGTVGVVHGFSFCDGQWGAEVEFYPAASSEPVHRFEFLSALEPVEGSLLPSSIPVDPALGR